jgi:hypothetical protein
MAEAGERPFFSAFTDRERGFDPSSLQAFGHAVGKASHGARKNKSAN